MKIRIRDKQAEREAWDDQGKAFLKCAVKPFPNNVPNFIPFCDISCYREVDTERLFFDEEGNLTVSS